IAAPGIRNQCRTIVENGIAIQILTDRDVIRHARTHNDEGVQTERVGQRNRSTKNSAAGDVELRSSIIGYWIVRIGKKVGAECRGTGRKSCGTATRTGSQVAVGVVERVKTKERKLRSNVCADIRD